MKRKEVFNTANGVANRQGSWIKWPLGPLFAFLGHNKVTIILPIKLSLKRKAIDWDILFGVDGQQAKLEIWVMEFWIPSIQPSLEINADITKRLNSNRDIAVNLLFRELSGLLIGKGMSLKSKGIIYTTCIRPAMLYGSETWPTKIEDIRKIQRSEMRMLRWMTGVSLSERKSNECVRSMLAIDDIAEVMR